MSTSVAFNVMWDSHSLAQLAALATIGQDMQYLMEDLSEEFGKAGVAFIRDNVHGDGRWQPSTGATAAGIDYEVDHGAFGATVHFLGRHMTDDGKHNVANMIDVGNFDENTELWASGVGNGMGFRAFPISARAGNVTQFLSVIHGMGSVSSEYPKFFSDNAVFELRDQAPNLAEKHLQAFLDGLVI